MPSSKKATIPTIYLDRKTERRYVKIAGKRIWLPEGVTRNNLVKFLALRKKRKPVKKAGVAPRKVGKKIVVEKKIVKVSETPRHPDTAWVSRSINVGNPKQDQQIDEQKIMRELEKSMKATSAAEAAKVIAEMKAERANLKGKIPDLRKEYLNAAKNTLTEMAKHRKLTLHKYLLKKAKDYNLFKKEYEVFGKAKGVLKGNASVNDLLPLIANTMMKDPKEKRALTDVRKYYDELHSIDNQIQDLKELPDLEPSPSPSPSPRVKEKKEEKEEKYPAPQEEKEEEVRQGTKRTRNSKPVPGNNQSDLSWHPPSNIRVWDVDAFHRAERESELNNLENEVANFNKISSIEFENFPLDEKTRMRNRWNYITTRRDELKNLLQTQAQSQPLSQEQPLQPIQEQAESIPEQQGEGRKAVSDEGLSTDQINHLMAGHPYYLGCIGSDEIHKLPIQPRTRFGFVMNTDPSSKPGKHWVAIYVDNRPDGSNSIEYYNSLADQPTRSILNSLRAIVYFLRPVKMMKFKVNKIADQNEDSSNCGYFAAKFLMDRFHDIPFAKASGYSAQSDVGERRIEEWKYLNGIEPFGFIGTSYEEDRQEGAYDHASPSVRRMITRYGKIDIAKMKICREPNISMIDRFAKMINEEQWEQNKEKLSYDKFFHLFLLLKLRDGTVLLVDKNETVDIRFASWETSANSEWIDLSVRSGMTLQDMFHKGEKSVGTQNFWIYDPRTHNCQFFIKWILHHTPAWNSTVEKFVMQNAEKTMETMGLVGKE